MSSQQKNLVYALWQEVPKLVYPFGHVSQCDIKVGLKWIGLSTTSSWWYSNNFPMLWYTKKSQTVKMYCVSEGLTSSRVVVMSTQI